MCGRFVLKTPVVSLRETMHFDNTPACKARYNIAPSQEVLVVRQIAGRREAQMMRWGLIPHWAKDPSIGYRMINARAETVAEKPAFRTALKDRRCIIMADGFYEWAKKGQVKQPYYIGGTDKKPFGFAGLWDRWQPPEGEPIESCTIITTNSNQVIAPFHDRMPVILDPKDYDLWLDPAIREPERLLPLLKQYPAKKMEAYPVSKVVNSPSHESPDCIKPLVGIMS